MNAFLLDTNVVSELAKPSPDRGVVAFLSSIDNAWISVISLHELWYGIGLLPKGKRRSILEEKLGKLLSEYGDFVIRVDHSEVAEAAQFRLQAKQQGRVMHLADALIAGTAKAHNLSLVTRNVGDFSAVPIDVVNPWGREQP